MNLIAPKKPSILLKNFYYDTSASPLLYDMTIFRNVIHLVGAEKIIFGSDYPLKLYPKKQKQVEMQTFIKDIQSKAGLNQNEYEQIFEKNICSLLNL